MKVCLPYFKDIFKDLQERSDNKSKGINRLSFLNYSQLPGLVAERFFAAFDVNCNTYLSLDEFLAGMLGFFCGGFDEKMRLIFSMYDFDADGRISQEDIITLISCMPVNSDVNVRSEGKYTKEGGGAQNFQERVDSLEEMLLVLQKCFGKRQHINLDEFKQITERESSDMALAIMALIRERLPCAENYYRYRRNF